MPHGHSLGIDSGYSFLTTSVQETIAKLKFFLQMLNASLNHAKERLSSKGKGGQLWKSQQKTARFHRAYFNTHKGFHFNASFMQPSWNDICFFEKLEFKAM